jgi:HlyD family secretion protein
VRVRSNRRVWLIVGAVVVLALLAAGAAVIWLGGDDSDDARAVYTVQRGPLTINVSLDGEIRSRDPAVINCEVEGRTTILELVDEGVKVAAGDVLVVLDSSQLEQNKIQQQIRVNNNEATFIRAREDLAVTASQGESDVAKAELDHRFALLDLEKYVEGEYPDKLQQAEADIALAKEELERAKDALEWSRKLAEEGYVTDSDLQADELAVKRNEIGLQRAESALHLLQEYTHQRDLEQRQSDVRQAERALERARRKAAANNLQAEADLQAKESELEQQRAALLNIEAQLERCVITAPVAGRVVYSTSVSGRWYVDSPIQEGREVREMEPIIYLPTSTSMMAQVYVPESNLKKVTPEMPVRVMIDALPNQVFAGTVHTISAIPDSRRAWLNPGMKEYEAEVYVDGGSADLRSGMNCRIDIIIDHYDDAVYVPVQCVVRVDGEPVVYVQTSDGQERRPVEAGLDNNRMVHIISGLDEGEKVLLAPPLDESTKPDDSGELPGAPASEPVDEPADEPTTQPADAEATTQPADDEPTTQPATGTATLPAGRPGGRRRHGAGGH